MVELEQNCAQRKIDRPPASRQSPLMRMRNMRPRLGAGRLDFEAMPASWKWRPTEMCGQLSNAHQQLLLPLRGLEVCTSPMALTCTKRTRARRRETFVLPSHVSALALYQGLQRLRLVRNCRKEGKRALGSGAKKASPASRMWDVMKLTRRALRLKRGRTYGLRECDRPLPLLHHHKMKKRMRMTKMKGVNRMGRCGRFHSPTTLRSSKVLAAVPAACGQRGRAYPPLLSGRNTTLKYPSAPLRPETQTMTIRVREREGGQPEIAFPRPLLVQKPSTTLKT
mmetsp:Transcript_25472/g.73078  ORF Transcript_25472/g.73078 Transcript_25472/m.73078 type:complete len:281 (-) Transcript_25472:3024-3866(-)